MRISLASATSAAKADFEHPSVAHFPPCEVVSLPLIGAKSCIALHLVSRPRREYLEPDYWNYLAIEPQYEFTRSSPYSETISLELLITFITFRSIQDGFKIRAFGGISRHRCQAKSPPPSSVLG